MRKKRAERDRVIKRFTELKTEIMSKEKQKKQGIGKVVKEQNNESKED